MKTYVYVAGPINSSGVQNRNDVARLVEFMRRRGLATGPKVSG